MKCLIDADTIAFACAASAEEDPEWVAAGRANDMVETILRETGATEYELWLSGPDNFRYNVYPEYKANRLDTYRPRWEAHVKDFLVNKWQANWSVGCEADDVVGYRQTSETIIAHLDKDINQVPGKHYNWELRRNGQVIRPAKSYDVTPEEGLRFFYYQMLIGDTTDNIKGVPGIGPKKAEKLLLGKTTEQEYMEVMRDMFSCDEEILLNGQVLWIWKKENDIWQLPLDTHNTPSENLEGNK